jgi:hypothetical protein
MRKSAKDQGLKRIYPIVRISGSQARHVACKACIVTPGVDSANLEEWNFVLV